MSENEMSDHNNYCLYSNINMSVEESASEGLLDIEVIGSEIIDNEGEEKSTNELLIDCVRGYPHLYDHADKNFKNNLMKENSWKEIASVMKFSAIECKTKWTKLRDKFAREKRQLETETRSGSGANDRSPFALYKNLLFLEKHIKRRQSYSNVLKPSQSLNLPFTENNVIVELEVPIPCGSNENEPENTPAVVQSEQETVSPSLPKIRSRPTPSAQDDAPNKKKGKLITLEESFIKLTETVQKNFMSPSNSLGPASTANTSFASLIVAELEALPLPERHRKKQRILQILYEPL